MDDFHTAVHVFHVFPTARPVQECDGADRCLYRKSLKPVALMFAALSFFCYTDDKKASASRDMLNFSMALLLTTLGAVLSLDALSLNALKEFFHSTGGETWLSKMNWMNGEKPCATGTVWYGLCCASEEIYGIVLESNNLTGVLPESIANIITHYFWGPIPLSLGSAKTAHSCIMISSTVKTNLLDCYISDDVRRNCQTVRGWVECSPSPPAVLS